MPLPHGGAKDMLITGYRARWYFLFSTLLGLSLIRRKPFLALSLKNGDNLLDVGCGSGDFLAKVYERYKTKVILFGVDGSLDMIEEAKKRNRENDIAFLVAAAQDLPFPSETFDYVSSVLVFHHLAPKGKRETIKEIRRVLKHGGCFVITDFGRGRNWFGKFFALLSSRHGYTRGNMELISAELLNRGFTIEHKGHSFGFVETMVATKS